MKTKVAFSWWLWTKGGKLQSYNCFIYIFEKKVLTIFCTSPQYIHISINFLNSKIKICWNKALLSLFYYKNSKLRINFRIKSLWPRIHDFLTGICIEGLWCMSWNTIKQEMISVFVAMRRRTLRIKLQMAANGLLSENLSVLWLIMHYSHIFKQTVIMKSIHKYIKSIYISQTYLLTGFCLWNEWLSHLICN